MGPLKQIFQADLTSCNSFGISAEAKQAVVFEQLAQWQELRALYQHFYPDVYVIGGGSNILITANVEGLVIFNRLKGIDIIQETEEEVFLRVAAGEVWHDLVMYTVSHNWGGLENLALIPGRAGAAPMQNIGAYGVELKDSLVSVEVLSWETGLAHTFTAKECMLAYRSSIFKTTHKGKFLIIAITLRLKKDPKHFVLSYGAVAETLKAMGCQAISAQDVATAVMTIRKSKLPDPGVLGNAGSFFKNPEISNAQSLELKRAYPDIPMYALPGDTFKVPAGWLIEQCGWKGKQVGQTGNHAQQALVIVNYGAASGEEIWQHAIRVRDSVMEKFGILLEPEVNIIPG
jgi:UDP-N-acetylmuramate dehydrogenase